MSAAPLESRASQELSSQMQNLLNSKGQRADVINEKKLRCSDFRDGKQITVCRSFKENTAKEELVLEHVMQFRRQYNLKYDEMKDLQLMYPLNECGVYKFICTTLRATKMAYIPLYDYYQASQKISQYIQYEELEFPDQYPRVIPAPANVLRWQRGDCFDMSIVLCSILLGTGYDAYVVVGKAPREVTTKNESQMVNPYYTKGMKQQPKKEKGEEEKAKEANKFTIQRKAPIHSKYDYRKQQEEEAERAKEQEEAKIIDDEEPDELPIDQYEGRRIHCWVLLKKGKRDVDADLFLEPSTGRIYPVEYNPYQQVDFLFNHLNFWINLRDDTEVRHLNYGDLYDGDCWEYVMLDSFCDPRTKMDLDEEDLDEMEEQEEDDTEDYGELDMPPSWSPKLHINKEQFYLCSILGEQTAFYLKSKVDSYAKYTQPDGLVMRITIYEDFRRLKILESREFFESRSDKLVLRRKFPFEFKTEEEYEQGRAPHWKTVVSVDRQERITTFYPNRNHDGLIQRIEKIGEKTVEKYENRDDRVIHRSIKFYISIKDEDKSKNNNTTYYLPDNHVGQVALQKMTQRFEKNPALPAHQQIEKMVFDFIKKKVIIYYHMNEGDIHPIIKDYNRESIFGFAKSNDNNGIGGENKTDDPLLQQEHARILQMEKDCYQSIRQQGEIAKTEQRNLMNETLVLEKSLHDKAREKFNQNILGKEEEGNENKEVDYLLPYLEKYNVVGKDIDKEKAQQIVKDVQEKLKERILSRVNIIQKRLQERKEQLDKLSQQQQKKGEEDEKNIDDQIQKLSFQIRIMDQRAGRFEVNALLKYAAMDQKLKEDPRLAAIHSK